MFQFLVLGFFLLPSIALGDTERLIQKIEQIRGPISRQELISQVREIFAVELKDLEAKARQILGYSKKQFERRKKEAHKVYGETRIDPRRMEKQEMVDWDLAPLTDQRILKIVNEELAECKNRTNNSLLDAYHQGGSGESGAICLLHQYRHSPFTYLIIDSKVLTHVTDDEIRARVARCVQLILWEEANLLEGLTRGLLGTIACMADDPMWDVVYDLADVQSLWADVFATIKLPYYVRFVDNRATRKINALVR